MRTIDTDVVIVGAGPAGIFCALSLLERGFTGRIVMVDKGLAVEDRVCPKQAARHARTANPAGITTGFSGAGASRTKAVAVGRRRRRPARPHRA